MINLFVTIILHMEKYIPILSSIGVHEHGAKVYLTLLDRWEKNIADITKLTGLYRVEIYRQLPYLIESGLVVEVQRGKRKAYAASHPRKIEEIHKDKQDQNSYYIDQLVKKYSYGDKKPRVVYQEWKKALMYVFSDIVNTLDKWEVFYRISSEKDVSEANTYLPKDYREKRDQKQLERYVIMSEAWAKSKKPRLERELVTIPPELDDFEDNVSMTLYGNKIAYIDFSTETSIIIEHAALVDFHKTMFRMMYMSLRK